MELLKVSMKWGEHITEVMPLLLATAVLIVSVTSVPFPEGVYGPQEPSHEVKELEHPLNGRKPITCNFKRSNISIHNGTPNINEQWRNGIFFHPSPDFTAAEMIIISSALTELNRHFCHGMAVWPQISNPTRDYVEIIRGTDGTGCNAVLGRQGGEQVMNLEEGCIEQGTIIHEALHSLGIDHEHNREDRDEHIDLFKDNVEPAMLYNFDKSIGFQTYNLAYDTSSIMHYFFKAFVLDPNDPHMFSMLKKGGTEIEWNWALSELDIAKLRAMYDCD